MSSGVWSCLGQDDMAAVVSTVLLITEVTTLLHMFVGMRLPLVAVLDFYWFFVSSRSLIVKQLVHCSLLVKIAFLFNRDADTWVLELWNTESLLLSPHKGRYTEGSKEQARY